MGWIKENTAATSKSAGGSAKVRVVAERLLGRLPQGGVPPLSPYPHFE